MSKSGITRRIDELGRIVVPKEMRYNLGIREGESLELYVENNSIVIKKYSQMENNFEYTQKLCDILTDACDLNILVSDREKIISSSKKYKSIINEKLDDSFKKLIDQRITYESDKKESYYDISGYFYITPIITSMDCIGLVILLVNEKECNVKSYAEILKRLITEKIDVS